MILYSFFDFYDLLMMMESMCHESFRKILILLSITFVKISLVILSL